MQIVINMPEEDFDLLKSLTRLHKPNFWERAILNGTPLPKGYGRLVDLDKMCADYWDGNYMEIHEDDLPNIPIIIEADKAESDDDKYTKVPACNGYTFYVSKQKEGAE